MTDFEIVTFAHLPESDEDEFIYALCDPETNQPRYVGRAVNVYARYAQHMSEAKEQSGSDRTRRSKKAQWLLSLKDNGLHPTLMILERTTRGEAGNREEYWINCFVQTEPGLTNYVRDNTPKIVSSKTSDSESSNVGEFEILEWYPIGEFAKLIGVSSKTLERWEERGKLVPNRTDTNRRIYTQYHYQQALKILGVEDDGVPE